MSRYTIQDLLQLRNYAHQYTEQEILQMQKDLPLRISTPLPAPREPLAIDVVVAGNIVWLEPQHHQNSRIMKCVLPECHRCTGTIEPRAFDHPAVILRNCHQLGPNGETMVLCCTMSSNPRPNAYHPRSLPVSSVSEDQGIKPRFAPEMCLENIPENFKKSNILNSHVYTIPLTQLTPYLAEPDRKFRCRLLKRSYTNLMSSVGLTPEPWIETSVLESGKLRFIPTSQLNQPTNKFNCCATAKFINMATPRPQIVY